MTLMNVKSAIQTGDAEALRRLLAADPSLANQLILWGPNDQNVTHPLHFISDMLFDGTLPKGREMPLVNALLEAGADLDFRAQGTGETGLIGAASLGAEDVGIRLLAAGADPRLRGLFGATGLHWAALLGLRQLASRLIPVSDLDLKDDKYNSSALGWAIHGLCNPPNGGQREIANLLIAAGAKIEPEQAATLRL